MRFLLHAFLFVTFYGTKSLGSLQTRVKGSNTDLNKYRSLKATKTVVDSQNQNKVIANEHGMPLGTLVINMIADLCPHGMLPLAYGFSQGGPSGLLIAIPLVAIFSAISGYTMTSIAEMAADTGANSYGDLWAILVSQKTKWIADLSIFVVCTGCCVFYSAFIGDIFKYLASSLGASGLLSNRTFILGSIFISVLLPLCLVEDLSGLQFSSLLGVTGILFTVAVHVKRLLDGSYIPSTSEFLKTMPTNRIPKWPVPKLNLLNANQGTLVLLNMLCVAYLIHYNAISYYKELGGRTLQRYRKAISYAFFIAFGVFTSSMLLGYLLFGLTSQPLILNNFHSSKDILATGARIGTGAAIIFAFPLMFAGVKSSMLNLFPKSIIGSDFGRKQLIIAILTVIASIAFVCSEEDVSLVLGIVGSLIGCGVAYIIPGILRLNWIESKGSGKQGGPVQKREVDKLANKALVAFGCISALFGVWVTWKTSIAGHGGHH